MTDISNQEIHGPVRVIELYRALSYDPPEDEFIAENLESEGLIKKRPDGIRYRLTGSGRQGLKISLAAMLSDTCTRSDSGKYDRPREESLRKLLIQAISE